MSTNRRRVMLVPLMILAVGAVLVGWHQSPSPLTHWFGSFLRTHALPAAAAPITA